MRVGPRSSDVASIWRAGCIIRAAFLEDITAAFLRPRPSRHDGGRFLLQGPRGSGDFMAGRGGESRPFRHPAPACSSALSYFDRMRSERLPARLVQAQRDFFQGAHLLVRGSPQGRVLPTTIGECTQTGGVPGTSIRSPTSNPGSASSGLLDVLAPDPHRSTGSASR